MVFRQLVGYLFCSPTIAISPNSAGLFITLILAPRVQLSSWISSYSSGYRERVSFCFVIERSSSVHVELVGYGLVELMFDAAKRHREISKGLVYLGKPAVCSFFEN